MRLADIRGMSSSLSSLNLSGSCKAVMCLELAATAFGEHVDKVLVTTFVCFVPKILHEVVSYKDVFV